MTQKSLANSPDSKRSHFLPNHKMKFAFSLLRSRAVINEHYNLRRRNLREELCKIMDQNMHGFNSILTALSPDMKIHILLTVLHKFIWI